MSEFLCLVRRVVVLLVAIIICVKANVRDNTGSCKECLQDSENQWIVDAECKGKCVERWYGGLPTSAIWRSATLDANECENVQYCTFKGNITNDYTEGWSASYSEGTSSPIADALEGAYPITSSRCLWFGMANFSMYQIASSWQTIPSDATHLSAFVLVYSEEPNQTNASFFISVDDVVLVHIDQPVFYQVQQIYDAHYGSFFYRNLDVYIHPFADGGKHKISFSYYNEVVPMSSIMVDYLRFIRDTSLKENSHFVDWPTHDYCGGGCDSYLLRDGQCHLFCATMACNYDNGNCEIPQNDERFCYNRQLPVSGEFDNVCSMYKTETCCTNMADLRIISDKIIAIEKNCKVESDCLKNIKAAFCAYCSPKNNRFMRNGTAYYCPHFSKTIYDTCKNSFFMKGGKCLPLDEVYPSHEEFLDIFGLLASDDYCFNDLSVEPFPIWAIAVIVVGGVLIIAAIVVVIVIVVRKKKAEAPSESNLVTVDQGVYMVDDGSGVNMVAVTPSGQYIPPLSSDMRTNTQQTTPTQPHVDEFSNPDSDVTLVQAFQD